MLGSSRCEILSGLDLKDAFKNFKKYYGILPYFGIPLYLYQRMPMELNITPSIWQSYINAIVDCSQSRKYCETIMDDLLLFTPTKKSHMAKLEDLLETLLKSILMISPKKCELFRKNGDNMGILSLLKIEEYVLKLSNAG